MDEADVVAPQDEVPKLKPLEAVDPAVSDCVVPDDEEVVDGTKLVLLDNS